MGCCGSVQDKDLTTRLDAVQQDIFDALEGPKSEPIDGLTKLGELANELLHIFNAVADAGAKDMESIARIEDISESILRNLLARLTLEEVKKGPDFKPLNDAVMAVAQSLDAVRATKATLQLERHVNKLQDQIHASAEKGVEPMMKRMHDIFTKLQEPAMLKNLIPGSKDFLDLAEKSQAAAGDSKKVVKDLLEVLVSHAVWVLEVESSWKISPEGCQAVLDIATRIDGLAEQLVVVLAAVWDPPIAPQVSRIQNNFAESRYAELICEAEKQLAAGDGGAAHDLIQALLPWWPVLKDSHALEVVGIFSKLQTYAYEAFEKAAASGDESTSKAIRGFAEEFDVLRARFTDLPPSSVGRALGEVLQASEAKLLVLKALDSIDAEVAKTTDTDKSTNLSLAATVQALESLKTDWPQAMKADSPEEVSARMDRSCVALETWTEDAAKLCPASKIGGLLKFADEYDSRRSQVEPAPAKGALRTRIASLAALTYLKVAQAELAKEKGLNPNALFDSLIAAAEAMKGGGSEEATSSLLQSYGATEERMLRSFGDALIAPGGESKEVMLMKFATSSDECRERCSLGLSDAGPLVTQMEAKRQQVASDLMQKAEEAADLASTLQPLQILAPLVHRLPEDASRMDRLNAICGDAAGHLEEDLQSARDAVDGAWADEILRLARGFDEVLRSLGLAGNVEEKLLPKVAETHLLRAEQSIEDLQIFVGELDILASLASGCPIEEKKLIVSFVDSLEIKLAERMFKVSKSDMALILEAAVSADKVRSVADPGDASLAAKLGVIEPVAVQLGQARAEVEKPSGMNPNLVVKILKELKPIWTSASGVAACNECLQSVLEQFNLKLADAGRKALSLEGEAREKKLAALRSLASEAQTAQAALVEVSAGSLKAQNFVSTIAVMVLEKNLTSAEEELLKETGMNPAALLKSIQALGKEWALIDDVGTELKDRWSSVREKVKARMRESMEEAVGAQNPKKQQALLKFATDFDAACSGFSGESSLEQDLKSLSGAPAGTV